MDALNSRLVLLLHERAALARTIGRHKRAVGIALADPEREAAMLQELLRATTPTDGFPPAALARLLQAVFAESRALVEQLGRE
ncbi:MAG: chorismate mutase [Planctomycetes bacterium]|nr:chorismate mutase [Planctomycetota bacterium]